jgi:hypothetical protein
LAWNAEMWARPYPRPMMPTEGFSEIVVTAAF